MLEVLHTAEKIIGAWAENRVILFIKVTADVTLLLYLVTGMALCVFKQFSDANATHGDIVDAIYTLQSTCNFLYDYVCRTILRKSLLQFFQNVKTTVVFNAPAAMCEVNARINKNVKIAVAYAILGSFSMIIFNLATYNYYTALYQKIARTHYNGFCYGLYYPYNYSQGLSFVIHVIITSYAYILLCGNSILYICSAYTAIECIVMKIEHLKMMLAEVMEAKIQLEQLKKCVKYHIHIISLVEQFNICYNAITTPAPFLYGATIGTVLYSLADEVTIKAAFLGFSYITATFLICLMGQRLIDKSESIGLAAFDINWYDMDLEARKCIQLMIIRSQKPLQYEAGPFGTFSLFLFASIMRCAYTFVTMQTNFKEE